MKISEELEQLLKNLHLKRILEIYDEQAQVAQKEDVPYAEFLTRLMRAQWHARQESALEWRIRRANLPERWSLETFPFARQPGVNRKQIRTLAELEFIPKAENIVFIGETARGKTGLACSRRWRTATAASSSAPKTSSTICMPRWPIVPPGSCSNAWRAWTSSWSTSWGI